MNLTIIKKVFWVCGFILIQLHLHACANFGDFNPNKPNTYRNLINEGKYQKWLGKWKKHGQIQSIHKDAFNTQALLAFQKLEEQSISALGKQKNRKAKRKAKRILRKSERLIAGIRSFAPDFFNSDNGKLCLRLAHNIECLPTMVQSRRLFQKGQYFESLSHIRTCQADLAISFERGLYQKFIDLEFAKVINRRHPNKKTANQFLNFLEVVNKLGSMGLPPSTLPGPSSIKDSENLMECIEKIRMSMVEKYFDYVSKYYREEKFDKSFENYDLAISISNSSEKNRLVKAKLELFNSTINDLDELKESLIEKSMFVEAENVVDKIGSFAKKYSVAEEKNKINYLKYSSYAKDASSNGDWLQTLSYWRLAEIYCSQLHCENCCDPETIKNELERAISKLEDKMYSLLDDGKLEQAINLAEKTKMTDSSYPGYKQINALNCIHNYSVAMDLFRNKECDDALKFFQESLRYRKLADDYCSRCEDVSTIEFKIKEMSECMAERFCMQAQEAYEAGDCVSATLYIDKAIALVPYISCKNFRATTFECAEKRVLIHVQGELSSSERSGIEGYIKSNLAKKLRGDLYGQFVTIIESETDNKSINSSMLRRYDADMALVINVSDVSYNTYEDTSPIANTYCTLKKEFLGHDINGCAVYRTYIEKDVVVYKYIDKSWASASYDFYILTADGSELERGNGRINETKENQIWRSSTDVKYIGYCQCPFQYLSEKEKSYFRNYRQFPSKSNLLLRPIKQKIIGRFNNINWERSVRD